MNSHARFFAKDRILTSARAAEAWPHGDKVWDHSGRRLSGTGMMLAGLATGCAPTWPDGFTDLVLEYVDPWTGDSIEKLHLDEHTHDIKMRIYGFDIMLAIRTYPTELSYGRPPCRIEFEPF